MDYADGSVIDCLSGEKSGMELSGSNVLRFEMEDGTTILVRPSGTEPLIRVMVEGMDTDEITTLANEVAAVITERLSGK